MYVAGVRRHDRALERVVGDAVHVREEHAHEVQDDRGREDRDGVRALVHRHAHTRTEDRRVFRHREIDRDDIVARVPGGEQVLDAVFDPLHRARELTRRDTDRDLLAARVRLLPERSADVTTPHRDEIGRMIEQRGHRDPQRVRVLVRDVDHQLAGVAAEVGEDRAAFHRHVGHALLGERLRHDDVRLRERGVDVAVACRNAGTRCSCRAPRTAARSSGRARRRSRRPRATARCRRRPARTRPRRGRGSRPPRSPAARRCTAPCPRRAPGGPARGTPAARAAAACRPARRARGRSRAMSTPGAGRAALTSTDRMRPCAMLLRTNAAWRMPGIRMSST